MLYLTEQVSVVSNDGKCYVGILRGFDQVTNIILERCHERIYSLAEGVEEVLLGLYIVRGDNLYVCNREAGIKQRRLGIFQAIFHGALL